MLAKKLKIETLKQQREFILDNLNQRLEIAKKTNGDMSYIYKGHIYHEVEEYFKKEGFTITPIGSEKQGQPLFLFTINCELSKEELNTAEEEQYQFSDKNTNDDLNEEMLQFFNSISTLARSRGVINLEGSI